MEVLNRKINQPIARYRFPMAVLLGIAGYGVTLYALRRITEGGLYADQYHTSGRIGIDEAAWVLIGLSSIIAAILLFAATTKRGATITSQASEAQKRLRSYVLAALVFAVLAAFVYWFAVLSIVFGIMAIVLSYQGSAGVLPLGQKRKVVIGSSLAIVASVASVVSVFSLH